MVSDVDEGRQLDTCLSLPHLEDEPNPRYPSALHARLRVLYAHDPPPYPLDVCGVCLYLRSDPCVSVPSPRCSSSYDDEMTLLAFRLGDGSDSCPWQSMGECEMVASEES